MTYTGKSIAVLGAGESGQSAARLLRRLGAEVTVHDGASADQLDAVCSALAVDGIRLLTGPEAGSPGETCDMAVLSPGIDPAVELVQGFVRRGIPLLGELELAVRECCCPVVAITGTNGKTTTTQLVERMFTECGVRTVAAGNIGPAFSGRVGESGKLDVMTLEVSSFQLETVETFRPRIAVWLGFAADHLDRYATMEEYFAAKLRVFERQTEEDWAVVNLRTALPALKARTLRFSAYEAGGDFELRDGCIHFRGEPLLRMADTQLRGLHNVENLMAALGVAAAWGLDLGAAARSLCDYRALPHRCEPVRTVDGVEWVNDSKGTNPDSVEKALLSETRRVVLIAGGKDKGFEYDALTDLVAERCRAAVVLGEMAGRIEALWGARLPCHNAGRSLERAVTLAQSSALPGDVVLFSPGTSSFDMFKNYADRGNQFRALVQALPALHPLHTS